MEGSTFRLNNPPIIEAVLDIECDLPPKLKIASIETGARKALAKNYPKFKHLFFHEIQAKPNEQPTLSVKGGIVGLQFLHDDEKQVVQFRSHGFSFNRLAPYSSLDDYLPQIKSAWMKYIKLAAPLQTRAIRLRYINRILLPFVNGRIELSDYFQNGPKLADDARLALTGFLNQYSAIDTETGFHVGSVITGQPQEGDNLPIIFDNSVAAPDNGKPEDWSSIRSKIMDLRALKNEIFVKTLTEKCLNQYQQP